MDSEPSPTTPAPIDPDKAAELVASYDRMIQSPAWQEIVVPTLDELRDVAVAEALERGANADSHFAGRERLHLINAIGANLRARRHNLGEIARGEAENGENGAVS